MFVVGVPITRRTFVGFYNVMEEQGMLIGICRCCDKGRQRRQESYIKNRLVLHSFYEYMIDRERFGMNMNFLHMIDRM